MSSIFQRVSSAIFYACASVLIIFVNKFVLTSFQFPSFQFLGLAQILATVVLLGAARIAGERATHASGVRHRISEHKNFTLRTIFGRVYAVSVRPSVGPSLFTRSTRRRVISLFDCGAVISRAAFAHGL